MGIRISFMRSLKNRTKSMDEMIIDVELPAVRKCLEESCNNKEKFIECIANIIVSRLKEL